MTRKELIQQEADIRFPDNPVAQSRFKDGAEWSDANPSEANIAMYLGKKGWPLSTCGIPTYEEAMKTLDKYYEYKRKHWMYNHIYIPLIDIRDRNHGINGFTLKGHIVQFIINIYSKILF